MKRENFENMLWIFCIITLLSLSLFLILKSSNYNCDNCSVILSNKIVGGEYYEYGEYQIKELFEEYYKEGNCALRWNPTQGYYNG